MNVCRCCASFDAKLLHASIHHSNFKLWFSVEMSVVPTAVCLLFFFFTQLSVWCMGIHGCVYMLRVVNRCGRATDIDDLYTNDGGIVLKCKKVEFSLNITEMLRFLCSLPFFSERSFQLSWCELITVEHRTSKPTVSSKQQDLLPFFSQEISFLYRIYTL